MAHDRWERFKEWREERRKQALIARKKALFKKDYEKLKLAARVLVAHFDRSNMQSEITHIAKLWAAYEHSCDTSLSNELPRLAAFNYTASVLQRMEKKPAARKFLAYFEIEDSEEVDSHTKSNVRVYENPSDQIGIEVSLKMNFQQFLLSFERYDLKDRVELFQEILFAGNRHPYFSYVMRAFVNEAHNPENLIAILTHKNYDPELNDRFLAYFISFYSDPSGTSHQPLSDQELSFFFGLFFHDPRIFSAEQIVQAIRHLQNNERLLIARSFVNFFETQLENQALTLAHKFFCLDILSRFKKPEVVAQNNARHLEGLKSKAEILFHQSYPEQNFHEQYASFVKMPNKFLTLRDYYDLSPDDVPKESPESSYSFISSMYKLFCIPHSTLPAKDKFDEASTIEQCCEKIRNQVQNISVILTTLKLAELATPKKQSAFDAALRYEVGRQALAELALLPNDPYGARQYLEEKSKPGFWSRVSRKLFWWTESNKKEIELTQLAQRTFTSSFSTLPTLVRQELPVGEEEMQPVAAPAPEVPVVAPKPETQLTVPGFVAVYADEGVTITVPAAHTVNEQSPETARKAAKVQHQTPTKINQRLLEESLKHASSPSEKQTFKDAARALGDIHGEPVNSDSDDSDNSNPGSPKRSTRINRDLDFSQEEVQPTPTYNAGVPAQNKLPTPGF